MSQLKRYNVATSQWEPVIVGAQGPTGPQGETGPQGVSIVLKGEVATTGDLPASGNSINDAYVVSADGNLWVWNGTTWFDAGQIVGPEGAAGPTGPTGTAGSTGPTGAQGEVGPTGAQGIQGEVGPTGAQGSIGPTGPAGADGATGPAGADGSSYTAGSGIDITSDVISIDLAAGVAGLDVNSFVFYDAGTQTISANWNHKYLNNVHIYKSSLPADFNTTVDNTWTVEGIAVVSVQEWSFDPSQWEITLAANYSGTQPLVLSKEITGAYVGLPNGAVIDTADNNVEIRGATNFNVEAVGLINLVTDAQGSGHQWQFGNDGGLVFPDSSVQTTAYIQQTATTSNTLNTSNDVATGTYENTGNQQITFTDPAGSGDFSVNIDYQLPLTASTGINVLGINTGILQVRKGVLEKFQTKSGATGTVTHDCAAGQVFYHTSVSANFTANFTNLNLSDTYATTVTLVIAQGATAYIPSAVQIGGSAQTIRWQGNSTPSGTVNRTDVVAFSILNNGGTYVVLGQLTGF